MKVVFILNLLALTFALSEGCHQGQGGKRKKRSSHEETEVWRDYFAACLDHLNPNPSYDWRSNVDFTILESQWYLQTENVLCSPENGYDSESCWNTEIEEYLEDDTLLPIVKQCITQYFIDISHDPPLYHYSSRKKRGVASSYPTRPLTPNPFTDSSIYINPSYSSCLQSTSGSKLKFNKLLSALAKHTVVRKCNSALRKRPITYAQKFLYLTKADSTVFTDIKACNRRHFPAPNFWSIYTPWTECKPSCNGRRSRRRFCHSGNNPKVNLSDSQCPGKAVQRQSCSSRRCWSAWGSWSRCSKTCHKGTKIRTRTCRGPAWIGKCAGNSKDIAHCNIGVECRQVCQGGQVYDQCPQCGRECQFIDRPPPCAPGCRPGCVCPGELYWSNKLKKCVTATQCRGCPPGQTYQACPPCEKTCTNRYPVCILGCKPGCACPPNQFWTGTNCVSECPCSGGQVFYNCRPCGRHCRNAYRAYSCTTTCKSGCACRKNYFWNPKTNKCVSESKCVPSPGPSWSEWSKFGSCVVRGGGNCGTGRKSRTRRCLIGIQQVKPSLCPGKDSNTQTCFSFGGCFSAIPSSYDPILQTLDI